MEAKLVVVGGKANMGEVKLRLPMTIGRGSKADLIISHPTVSRIHCLLTEVDGALVVRDNGSSNGTFVDNENVKESVVRPGQMLKIGPLTFRADYKAAAKLPDLAAAAEQRGLAETATIDHGDFDFLADEDPSTQTAPALRPDKIPSLAPAAKSKTSEVQAKAPVEKPLKSPPAAPIAPPPAFEPAAEKEADFDFDQMFADEAAAAGPAVDADLDLPQPAQPEFAEPAAKKSGDEFDFDFLADLGPTEAAAPAIGPQPTTPEPVIVPPEPIAFEPPVAPEAEVAEPVAEVPEVFEMPIEEPIAAAPVEPEAASSPSPSDALDFDFLADLEPQAEAPRAKEFAFDVTVEEAAMPVEPPVAMPEPPAEEPASPAANELVAVDTPAAATDEAFNWSLDDLAVAEKPVEELPAATAPVAETTPALLATNFDAPSEPLSAAEEIAVASETAEPEIAAPTDEPAVAAETAPAMFDALDLPPVDDVAPKAELDFDFLAEIAAPTSAAPADALKFEVPDVTASTPEAAPPPADLDVFEFDPLPEEPVAAPRDVIAPPEPIEATEAPAIAEPPRPEVAPESPAPAAASADDLGFDFLADLTETAPTAPAAEAAPAAAEKAASADAPADFEMFAFEEKLEVETWPAPTEAVAPPSSEFETPPFEPAALDPSAFEPESPSVEKADAAPFAFDDTLDFRASEPAAESSAAAPSFEALSETPVEAEAPWSPNAAAAEEATFAVSEPSSATEFAPAPSPVPAKRPVAAAAAKPSFFAKLLALFGGSKKGAKAKKTAAASLTGELESAATAAAAPIAVPKFGPPARDESPIPLADVADSATPDAKSELPLDWNTPAATNDEPAAAADADPFGALEEFATQAADSLTAQWSPETSSVPTSEAADDLPLFDAPPATESTASAEQASVAETLATEAPAFDDDFFAAIGEAAPPEAVPETAAPEIADEEITPAEANAPRTDWVPRDAEFSFDDAMFAADAPATDDVPSAHSAAAETGAAPPSEPVAEEVAAAFDDATTLFTNDSSAMDDPLPQEPVAAAPGDAEPFEPSFETAAASSEIESSFDPESLFDVPPMHTDVAAEPAAAAEAFAPFAEFGPEVSPAPAVNPFDYSEEPATPTLAAEHKAESPVILPLRSTRPPLVDVDPRLTSSHRSFARITLRTPRIAVPQMEPDAPSPRAAHAPAKSKPAAALPSPVESEVSPAVADEPVVVAMEESIAAEVMTIGPAIVAAPSQAAAAAPQKNDQDELDDFLNDLGMG